MKIYSLEGLKDKARNGYTFIGTDTASQRVRGVTVRSEDNVITCLHQSQTYFWFLNGALSYPNAVAAVLEPDYVPPHVPSTEESFAKFDAWHTAQLPVVATYVQTEGREKCETLVRLGEQWGVLYSGTEGYLRAQDMLGKHPDEGKRTFLIQKLDSIESALLDIAEKFVAEYQRLGLTVLREAEHA